MLPMLILDKRHALERLVVLSARAHVPEQFLMSADGPSSDRAGVALARPDAIAAASIVDAFWTAAERTWSTTTLAA
jgi:hypothetical protein